MGHPPKWPTGGPLSYRTKNGERVNCLSRTITQRKKNGTTEKRIATLKGNANPGNLFSVGSVGGGQIGSKLAHENEAPFPEKLAEFFIKSFCPPGGIVLDPFGGSGTTASVAKQNGRGYISVDIRQSQIELTQRRLNE
jgi:DNA modification methylase